jgi:ubiquinone/menaquinone biosynthesis C-methylase UbiE
MNRLLEEWLPASQVGIVLKTDLWNEAIGHDDALGFFKTRCSKLFGIDISQEVTRAAAKNFKCSIPFKFFQGDIQHLPFADNSIDVIFSVSTLDHLHEQQIVTSLREMRRVLTDNGHVIVTVDNVTYLFLRALAYRLFSRFKKSETFDNYHPYLLAEFRNFIAESGLDLMHWTGINLLPNFTQKVYVTTDKRLLKLATQFERTHLFDLLKYELVFHLQKLREEKQ